MIFLPSLRTNILLSTEWKAKVVLYILGYSLWLKGAHNWGKTPFLAVYFTATLFEQARLFCRGRQRKHLVRINISLKIEDIK